MKTKVKVTVKKPVRYNVTVKKPSTNPKMPRNIRHTA